MAFHTDGCQASVAGCQLVSAWRRGCRGRMNGPSVALNSQEDQPATHEDGSDTERQGMCTGWCSAVST